MSDIKVRFKVWGIDKRNVLNPSRETKAKRVVFCHESYTVHTSLIGENNGIIFEDEEKSIFIGKKYTNRYKKNVIWDFGDGYTVNSQNASHSYAKAGKYTISCTLFAADRTAIENGYKVDVIVKEPIASKNTFTESVEDKVKVRSGKTTALKTLETRLSHLVKGEPEIHVNRVQDPSEEYEKALKEVKSPLEEKYWEVFQRNQNKLIPIDEKFSPIFDTLYGKYFWNESTNSVDLKASIITSEILENTDRRTKITLIDPNAQIPANLGEDEFAMRVIKVECLEEIPKDQSVIGKRAFTDLYYKSDMVGLESRLFFKFPDGIVNTVPVEVVAKTIANTKNSIKYAWTVNGFIHELEGDVDKFLLYSLLKNTKQRAVLVPYVKYEENSLGLLYYIPKDLSSMDYEFEKGDSKIKVLGDSHSPFLRIEITPSEILDASVSVSSSSKNYGQYFIKGTKNEDGEVYGKDEILVPHEIYHREDVEKLVLSMTPHEMFDDTPNVREALQLLLGNHEWLDITSTKILKFFNNTVNLDTCHIEYLISILKSMGENPSVYDETQLGAVNEIREFTRLLSMEHTNLVGHMVKDELDISYSGEEKPQNIGDEILVNDILSVNSEGLVVAFEREGKYHVVKGDPLPLVIWDNYTHQSKVDYFRPSGEIPERPFVKFNDKYSTANTYPFSIKDYAENWGWGLLLPERYEKVEDAAPIISSYYKFFLLAPYLDEFRYGNYVDETTMDEEFLHAEKWDKDWGTSFRILLKLL